MTMKPNQILFRNEDLQATLVEMEALTNKAKLSRQDLARFDYLKSRASALKAGFSPQQVRLDELNRAEHRMGEPLTRFPKYSRSEQEVAEARAWLHYAKTGEVETRIGEVGNAQISYEKQGSFVPVQFFDQLFAAMKVHDPLFDAELVTYVETERGGLMQCPLVSDLGNVAEPIVESGDDSGDYADLTSTGHAESQPKAYRTPLWATTLEAEQDLNLFMPAIDMARFFFQDRIARGVGRDLVNGDGNSGRILGIIAQLIAAGANPVIAAGSAENTGGSETGANSIGTSDIVRLYTSVDAAYRASKKAAFLMNDDTLTYILKLVDKQGRPIVHIDEGYPYIFSKPVLVAPSLDSFGPSKDVVLFGDFSYWLTHCANGAGYIVRYVEAPGLIEKGDVGFRAFVRYDGQLLWSDFPNSKPPINILRCHS
jgi:HK97 family phage major capsid protein